MIGIYCITNKINGKKYIGQSKDVFKRWFEHTTSSTQSNKLLHDDIIKCGIENFTFEVLEICEDSISLNEKEIYYINKYQSFESGYNETVGGNGTKKYYTYNKDKRLKIIYKLLKESNLNLKEIGDKVGLSCSTINDINNGRIGFDTNIKYPIRNKEECLKIAKAKISRKIAQYNMNGEHIQTFDSITEACNFLKLSRYSSSISACCKGKHKSAYGYIWRYLDDVKK